MPTCTVMVGLPATGKSTIVSQIIDNDSSVFVYSTDATIERIAKQTGKSYDELFLNHIESAQRWADNDLAEAVRSGRDVIWDQTNLSAKKRAKIINRIGESGYTANCICILPPDSDNISDRKEWESRLDGRQGKTVPLHVIRAMAHRYAIPTPSEGFDSLTFYNMYGVEVHRADSERSS